MQSLKGIDPKSDKFQAIEKWVDTASTYAESLNGGSVNDPDTDTIGDSSNDLGGQRNKEVERVGRFIWVSVSPALFRCVDHLHNLMKAHDQDRFSEILREDLVRRISTRTSSTESSMAENSGTLLTGRKTSKWCKGRKIKASYRHPTSVKQSCGTSNPACLLFPLHVMERLPTDHSSNGNLAKLEPEFYQAIRKGDMTLEDYQTLRFLFRFFHDLSLLCRDRKAKIEPDTDIARRIAEAFYKNLGLKDAVVMQNLILQYPKMFAPLIQWPHSNKNSFLLADKTKEGIVKSKCPMM